MKTDYETMIQILDNTNIAYATEVDMLCYIEVKYIQNAKLISIEHGYSGFYTNFTFDELGKLLDVSAYE
jgi:hypothetical protein